MIVMFEIRQHPCTRRYHPFTSGSTFQGLHAVSQHCGDEYPAFVAYAEKLLPFISQAEKNIARRDDTIHRSFVHLALYTGNINDLPGGKNT